MHINSTDPTAAPVIDPHYLERSVGEKGQGLDFCNQINTLFALDTKILVDGVKFARKIAQTAPLSQYIESLWDPSEAIQSEEEYLTYVKTFTTVRTSFFTTIFILMLLLQTIWHPIGTASLGSERLNGVVSNRLIVHGTSNLRVADASVIPMHISAHTQETVYGIAEKVRFQLQYILPY